MSLGTRPAVNRRRKRAMDDHYAFFTSHFDLEQMEFPLLQGNRALVAMLLLLAAYLLYYAFFVVSRPRVVGGGRALREHLLSRCPSLRQYYWPTVWAFTCHQTTILRAILQRSPPLQYRREILVLADGGEVALDWAVLPEDWDRDTPIMLILAGLTGDSEDSYIKHLACDGLAEKYRPVVFNQRGNGQVMLKTPRTYSATNIEDLEEVLQRLGCLYPSASIVGVGVSLGGMLLTQYLHKTGHESRLQAVMVVSAAWDAFKTQASLERRLSNKYLYSKFLTRQLKSLVKRHAESITNEQKKQLPYNVDQLLQVDVVSEFDEHLTVPLFGYASVSDYYSDACNWDKMHRIQRPFLCLTAEDDPFVPKDSLPLDEFEKNPLTVMVVTTHGGHFGFLTGLLPHYDTWMNTVCRQFLSAIKTYTQHQEDSHTPSE